MNKKLSISFFCPAYNDEENLSILIPKVVSLLQKICSQYEVIIIEDASPDNSGKVADELARTLPHVKVIHHEINQGYGGALNSGFAHAKKFPYIFYTDGDNQYDVTVLKKMLPFMEKYDAVIGRRTAREITTTRKIQSIVYNDLIRLLFHLPVHDVNCAIRLIKRENIKKISLSSKSAFLPVEMLIKLNAQGARIKEIDVKHYPRMHGKASGGKLSVILPTFWDMITYSMRKH